MQPTNVQKRALPLHPFGMLPVARSSRMQANGSSQDYQNPTLKGLIGPSPILWRCVGGVCGQLDVEGRLWDGEVDHFEQAHSPEPRITSLRPVNQSRISYLFIGLSHGGDVGESALQKALCMSPKIRPPHHHSHLSPSPPSSLLPPTPPTPTPISTGSQPIPQGDAPDDSPLLNSQI